MRNHLHRLLMGAGKLTEGLWAAQLCLQASEIDLVEHRGQSAPATLCPVLPGSVHQHFSPRSSSGISAQCYSSAAVLGNSSELRIRKIQIYILMYC